MTTIRRFEFTDAKSSKFWEIHVRGSETVTTWGRLGTDGQTREKEFATDAKADADMAKKIAEKIKKGYVEVGSSSAPAPSAPAPSAPPPSAPAPAPAPEPPRAHQAEAPSATTPSTTAPSTEAPVASPSDDPFDVEPIVEPDHPPVSMPAAWKKHVKPMRGHDGAARALGPSQAAKARELFEVPPEAFVDDQRRAEVAAALFEAYPSRTGFASNNDEPDWSLLIDDWVERAGLANAFRLVDELYYVTGFSVPMGNRLNDEAFQARLRQHLVAADDAVWTEVRSVALSLCGRSLRAPDRLAASFPGDQEFLDLALATMPHQTNSWAVVPGLLVSVASVDQLDAVLNHMRTPPRHSRWDRSLPTLLDRLGPELVPHLEAWLNGRPSPTATSTGHIGTDEIKAYAMGLASINSDAALEVLASLAADKHVYAQLAKAVAARPHSAIRVLAPRLRQSEGRDKIALRFCEQIVRETPGVITAEREQMIDTTFAALADLVVSPATGPQADEQELPELLRSPPWLNRPKPSEPVVLEVATHERPITVDGTLRRLAEDPTLKTEAEWRDLADQILANARIYGQGRLLFTHAPAHLRLELLEDHLLPAFRMYADSAEEMLEHLVACVGADAFDAVYRHATHQHNWGFDVLHRFDAVAMTTFMATSLQKHQLARRARTWLLTHRETAAIGLIPVALGPLGADRSAAEPALRMVALADRELVQRVSDSYGPEVRAEVDRQLGEAAFAQLPKRMPKLPDFARHGSAPPPMLASGDKSLPDEATANLATMLQLSSLADPFVGVAAVCDALEPESVATWAWALFEAWVLEGKPSKHSWVLDAQGLVGNDETVRKLTPLVRAWPGEGGHKRAVSGLDALAAIGTEFALMQIYAISRKVKFKGIKARAQEKVEEIAHDLGLAAEQLADRLVPDFDLDEHGSMTLDYGPRSFTVGFDQELKPFVKDESGKIRKALPSPGVKDDPELAPAAKKQFSQLKKDVRTVAADNLLRLEMAMCTERRWNADDFRQYFLEHPLIVHLARRLVWATFDKNGVVDTFRVAEDGSLATPDDDVFSLAPDATVGIPHSLHLQDAVAAAWGETFADYELLQPFDQLARESYEMTADELAAEKFTRFSTNQFYPIGRFLGLGKFGWERGQPQDAGVVVDMIKRIDAETALHLHMDGGIWTGMVGESEDTAIHDVQIGGGVTWRTGDRAFAELSPIVRSELIRDLTLAFPDDA